MSRHNFPERLRVIKLLGFEPGAAFVLAEEVPNPTPDRRYNHDWRKLANIPAGKRFRVIEEFVDLDRTEKMFVLQPCDTPHYHQLKIWLDSDAALWDALVPNLVRDERSFDDVMWRADYIANVDAKEILRHLVETKRLTFLDIDMLVDELAAQAAQQAHETREEKEKAS